MDSRYIYMDNININSFDNACELCYAAKKYMLPHLLKECIKYLWSKINPKNAFQVYEYARLLQENVLMEKCLQVISLNTKEVLKDSSFNDIDYDTMRTVFSLEHLNVDSELDLFEAAARHEKAQIKQPNEKKPIADPDTLVNCDLMDGCDAFLTVARDRHNESSPTRQLHNQEMDMFVSTCNSCKSHVETRHHCTVCDDFDLCVPCHDKAGHPHKMEKLGLDLDVGASRANMKQADPQEARKLSIQRCIQSLVHACQCRVTCRRPSCLKMKRVVAHTKTCKRKTKGDCPTCKQLIALCCYHAKHCFEAKCSVTFCSSIKLKLKQQQRQVQQQQQLLRRRMAAMTTRGMPPAGPRPPASHALSQDVQKALQQQDTEMEDDQARSEATFRFTATNVRNLQDPVLSPPCYVRNLPWKIKVMPCQAPDRQPQKFLAFFLQCDGENKSSSWSCSAKAELRLTSHKPGSEPCFKRIQHMFCGKDNNCGFSDFMAWNDVVDPEKGYIKDDAITLEVHVTAGEPHGVSWGSKKHTGYGKNREKTIRGAIEQIRFLTLSAQQFAEGPARSPLLAESEAFAVLMHISSRQSNVPLPRGFSVSREPRKQLNKRKISISNSFTKFINQEFKSRDMIRFSSNFYSTFDCSCTPGGLVMKCNYATHYFSQCSRFTTERLDFEVVCRAFKVDPFSEDIKNQKDTREAFDIFLNKIKLKLTE